jgi:hypothetical protein
VKSTREDKKFLAKDFSKDKYFSEEITEDQTVEDKAYLQVAKNKILGEVGNVIYLLDTTNVDGTHNMDEQGTIMENIFIETEVKLFLDMVRFDFMYKGIQLLR